MDFISRIRLAYLRKIYPRISHFRGATRIMKFLDKMVYSKMDSIDSDPQSIFDRGNWDNLIILDACRYDKYNEIRDYEVESRITLGSTSKEYVERTFTNEKYDDLVYISANGYLTDTMLEKNLGHADIFHAKFDTIEEKWDKEKGTVRPEKVVEDANAAEKLFPEKKKIIHFIQPHYPFLTRDFTPSNEAYLPGEGDFDTALKRAEKGEIPRNDIVKAYEENLDEVLQHADELVEQLAGKTVITADHGELLGEKGLYAHPRERNLTLLREVPWDVVSDD